jgi:hypothetical protein
MGYPVNINCPGSYHPQPEEVLMDFFNDSRNFEAFKQIRESLDPKKIPGNRVPQYYPYAVDKVFNVESHFAWNNQFDTIVEEIKKGNAVQLCLKKPGHYVAAIAYDDETDEIIFNDSWPDRFKDKNGFNRRMGRNEYNKNVKKWYIGYTTRDF